MRADCYTLTACGANGVIALEAPLAALAATAAGEEAQAIEAATSALAKATEPFAALRMNRGIQQALAGKKLEEV